MKKILYGISGIGNGHVNRELPIIEELARTCEIMIFAHDDSLRVTTEKFIGNPNVTIVPVGLTFIVGSEMGLNFAATANAPQNQKIDSFRTSFEALDKVIRRWGRADLVITDYEPISAQYAYAYNVPLVTIDQQSKFLYGELPQRLGGFTYTDEVARLSMFFPKVSTRIACSFFKVSPRGDAQEVMLVPPTIKESVIQLRDGRKPDKDNGTILVYVSSAKELSQSPEEIISVLKSQDGVTFHLFVPKVEFARYNESRSANTVIYPHGDINFTGILAKANGIISTAGHSLLSEAMFLSIPVYAVPVEPYEQHLNAWAVEKNDFGVSATKITEQKLAEFLANLNRFTRNITSDTEILMRGIGQEVIVEYLRKNFLTPKKRIVIFSPPFSGHLNILKEFIKDHKKEFEFRLIITGWKNIKPDLTDVDPETVKMIEKSQLSETDPSLWTFPRTSELLGECLDAVREFQPDLIIYDFFSLEGNLAGRLLDIPYWCSIPAMIGPFDNQGYRDKKFDDPVNQKALDEIKSKYGLKIEKDEVEMVSDGFHLPGLINLVWSFRELTISNFRDDRSSSPFVFVGNLRGDNYEKTNYINKKPLIYFSLGTVVMDNLWNQQAETREKLTGFIRKLAEIWREKNYQIIFTTQGKKVLDVYPDNWWVYDSVDQVEILSRADLFITHGGSNSFHEAVMQKVPMIVIPFFGDQLLVADRTEQLGLGIKAGGSTSIDTHESKDFLNDQLAIDLTAVIERMLLVNDFVRNYLNLEVLASPLAPLIRGEIPAAPEDLVIGEKVVTPPISSRVGKNISHSLEYFLGDEKDEEKIIRKKIDFFATLFRVHIPLSEGEELPLGAAHALGDDDYFDNGVQFYLRKHNTWIPTDFADVRKRMGMIHHQPVGKPLSLKTVLVTSESPIKIGAVSQAFGRRCSVKGADPRLGHDEQLVGMDEIVFAVVDRARAVEKMMSEDVLVSIVSGLRPGYHQFLDVGLVLVKDKRGKTAIARSMGLALPLNAVQRAKLRGFRKFSVGKVLGEDMAEREYETDPHSLITAGKQKRKDLLRDAVVRVLDHLSKETD